MLGVPVRAGRRREGKGADGVHALLPCHLRQGVAALESQLPTLPHSLHGRRGQRPPSPADPKLSLA